jgi:hypothetical protein
MRVAEQDTLHDFVKQKRHSLTTNGFTLINKADILGAR